MKITTTERVLLFYLPALVLVVSFVGVCVQAGTPWPWNRVVHEDGRRTLLETIFYFEHATRELLLDAVLAVAIAGAVRYFHPLPGGDDTRLRQARRRLGAWTAAALAVILIGTYYSDGPQAILNNLAQFYTRLGAPPAWGAHWRYHLIERFSEFALAFAICGAFWILDGRPEPGDTSAGRWLIAGAFVAFAAATLLFGLSTEPFSNPLFLGHQLRELFTHALVTVPLALGTCFVLARRYSKPASTARSDRSAWPVYAAAMVSIGCGAFLLVGSVLYKAQSYGQKASLAQLIFPHFFEHSLGYVFVAALAGYCYLAKRPSPKR